jgi:hypothetical protein
MKFSFKAAPAVRLAAALSLRPVVLLVGAAPDTDALLRDAILAAVPVAHIEAVASVNDLVFRLADPGAAVVVIDGAHVPDLSPTLMPLLAGMAPKLQAVLVHTAPDAESAGARCVPPDELAAWLRLRVGGAAA